MNYMIFTRHPRSRIHDRRPVPAMPGRGCNRTPHDACPPRPAVPPRADPRAVKTVEDWESGNLKRPAGEVAPDSL